MVSLEITLSHETDKEISTLMSREALFHRGLYSQYVRKNYSKAKEYYKNAILTKIKPKHAVECWLNKMITSHEPLLNALIFLKKHKNLWKSKPRNYKILKSNIKKAYTQKGQLIEIYDIDKRKIRLPWENTQLFIRRLLKYDPSIIRIHTFYETKGLIPQKNIRNYTATRSRAKNSIYVAELAHDAASCKVAKKANLPFYYDVISVDNVKVNNEKYKDWIEKSESQFKILKDNVEWVDQVIKTVGSKMLKDIDFDLPEDYDEFNCVTTESDEKPFTLPWDNFHID